MNPVEAGYRVLNEALLRTVFLFSGSPGNPAGSSSELFILHPHSKIWYWEINKSVLWLLFASFQEPPNTDKHKEQSTGISVQSLSLVRLYDPRELQHTRLPCPSSPQACSNLRPLIRWCHPTILSSVVPFPSCLQSFPASGSFLMSWQEHHVAKVLELQLQHQSLQWILMTGVMHAINIWWLSRGRSHSEPVWGSNAFHTTCGLIPYLTSHSHLRNSRTRRVFS